MSNHQEIYNKLNQFKKRYYLNLIIKGIIFSIVIITGIFILLSFIEYFAYLNVLPKTILLTAYSLLILIILFLWIIKPFIKILKIGTLISDKFSALLISSHFTQINDNLVNILELNQTNSKIYSSDLILASIEQKLKIIIPLDFNQAINFKSNIKYLKYFVILLLVIFFIIGFNPQIFTEASIRVLNYNTHYNKVLPYKIIVENKNLITKQGDDFNLIVKVEGKTIPNEIFIQYNNNSYQLIKSQQKNVFTYSFKNIYNSINFTIKTDNFESNTYELTCLLKPSILNYSIAIDFPNYLNEKSKNLKNVGDIIIPSGTFLTWKIDVLNIDSLKILIDSNYFNFNKNNKIFIYNRQFFKSFKYKILCYNKDFKNYELFTYHVKVIPDLYPNIFIESQSDSSNLSNFTFKGKINDDYGFSNLFFKYQKINTDNNQIVNSEYIKLPIEYQNLNQSFLFSFDFTKIQLNANEKIRYYFEIFDNDEINNFKSTKSSVIEFKLPSITEISKLDKNASNTIENKIDEAKKLVNEIQSDISKLQQKNLTNPELNWEKTQLLKGISEKQFRLDNLVKEIQQQNKQNNDLINNFTQFQDEILKKQKQIEDLLNSLLTDEMKKLLMEIQQLQNQINQKNINQITKDLQNSYKKFNDQLDRNLELLKRFDIEKKINFTIDKLNELSSEQKKTADDVKSNKNDSLSKTIQNQSDKFNDIINEYNNIIEENSKLKNPLKVNEFQKEVDSIRNNFNEINKSIPNSKNQKLGNKINSNSKSIKNLADKMSQMQEENNQNQKTENSDDIRQLIDNIEKFSFEQEDILKLTKNISTNDPIFNSLFQKQKKLIDDFKIINDSISALSKRTPEISNLFYNEIYTILNNSDKIFDNLQKRKTQSAAISQQYILTSANNLALFLSEMLDQMQNNSNGSSSNNSKSKKKSKNSNPSFSDLMKMQNNMKKQMEKMLDDLKNGKTQNNEAQQLTQMLAQQEIFQKMLNELMNKTSLNPEVQKQLNEINKLLEKNKNDIVNKRITPETLFRNQQITTRLLEAEKSQNQREKDNKRESNEGQDKTSTNNQNNFKIIKQKNKNYDELNYNHILLLNYYKKIYDNYLKSISK